MQTISANRGSRLAIITMICALTCVGGASAQQPPADCQAPPQDGQAGGNTEPNRQHSDGSGNMISDCEGVLQPPPMPDQGLVEPAPDVGRTPVVPPSSTPPQQTPGQQ